MTAAAPPTERSDSEPWWKATWPLHRAEWIQLGVSLAFVVVGFSLVGWLATDALAPNALTRFDQDVAERFASGRTNFQTDLAHWSAMLAATHIKIIATAVFAVVATMVWKRWHEAVFLALTLIFEATAFVIVSFIVGRPRPDVERLLDSPVDSSFPSGHVAAATVYGALVIIVFWHTRNRWIRALAVVLLVAVVLAVALARMYQGMHYLSDVVAGVVLGIVSLVICLRVLGTPDDVVPRPDEIESQPTGSDRRRQRVADSTARS
ncbi:phosphatase PAP2 family protein [Ilumatobacter nonamiensis]|uniref:phosphatase PAP2 family protein n=1 Tax=Ilumatobacter nonamiensis TaxID=467093 RepID=UPI00034B6192|nr:phosphatase PAP2 family protein [Ilumatobacter nonamiensis]